MLYSSLPLLEGIPLLVADLASILKTVNWKRLVRPRAWYVACVAQANVFYQAVKIWWYNPSHPSHRSQLMAYLLAVFCFSKVPIYSLISAPLAPRQVPLHPCPNMVLVLSPEYFLSLHILLLLSSAVLLSPRPHSRSPPCMKTDLCVPRQGTDHSEDNAFQMFSGSRKQFFQDFLGNEDRSFLVLPSC